MENLMMNNSNLNCFNQNNVNENMELCNEDLLNNSVFISGLCDPSKVDLMNKMWKQETLDSCISILNTESEIKQIDSINAKIEILNTKVIETPTYNGAITDNYEGKMTTGRKLLVQGLLCTNINYVENSANQPVNSFMGNIPFSSYIVLPKQIDGKDTLTLNFMVSSCIEAVHLNSIRKTDVYLSATFTLLADKVDNVCDMDSPSDCYKTNNSCNSHSCMSLDNPNILGICPIEKIKTLFTNIPNPQSSIKYWNEISVPEILTISKSKPDIEQIISVVADVEILCKKVIRTPKPTDTTSFENKKITGKKLLIEGLLHQRITYISKDSSNSIYSCNFNIPISTYIIVPEQTSLNDKFDITCCIEDIHVCILNCRQIFKGVNVFFKASPTNCVLNNAI